MKCHTCQSEVQPGSKFCPNCGQELEATGSTCVACHAELKPNAKFCHVCGETVTADPLKPAAAQHTTPVKTGTGKNRGLMIALLAGVPVMVAILFILFYPRSNPAPVNASAPASGQAEHDHETPQTSPPDMAAMAPVFARIDSLKAAVTSNPQDTLALTELAALYEMAGYYDKASGYYRDLIAVSPHNFPARMNLASVYFNQAKHDSALQELQVILNHVPNYTFAMYNMGVIYAAMDNKEQARTWWQKVVDQDGQGDLGKRAAEGIQRLTQ